MLYMDKQNTITIMESKRHIYMILNGTVIVCLRSITHGVDRGLACQDGLLLEMEGHPRCSNIAAFKGYGANCRWASDDNIIIIVIVSVIIINIITIIIIAIVIVVVVVVIINIIVIISVVIIISSSLLLFSRHFV